MSDGGELIFVCGRLRPGAELGHEVSDETLLGAAIVRGKLFEIEGSPGLVLLPGASEVRGEVFRVGEERLRELDGLIGGPLERVTATASMAGGEHEVWVWAYGGDFRKEKEIIPPDWLFHRRPRRPPWFGIIAWLPLLVLVVSALAQGNLSSLLVFVVQRQSSWLGPGFLIMTAAAAIALWRRERGEEPAVLAFLLGVVGVVVTLFVEL